MSFFCSRIQSRVPHSILSNINIYVVTFYFEIIMDLQKIEKKKKRYREILCTFQPVSPRSNTLCNYTTVLKPGN